MIKCKVVYGPQGCGKTTNSEALMSRLSCVRAVDIEDAGDLTLLGADVLVLTNQPVAGALNYADVMSEIERFKSAVREVIREELRPGGLLSD